MTSDEEYGAALLRPLDDEPATASTVDITKALAEGRRRRRTRKIRVYCASTATAVVVLAAAGLAAVPALSGAPTPVASPRRTPAHAGVESTGAGSGRLPESEPSAPEQQMSGPVAPVPPTACSVARLPVPDGRVKSIVTGADPTGRYILGRSYDPTMKVWIWFDGSPRQVPMAGEDEALVDVNEAGVAVGSAWIGGNPRPYVYRDGKVSELPGVTNGTAVAINRNGQIVGLDLAAKRPVLWHSATEAPTRLNLPSGAKEATVQDITDTGMIFGGFNNRAYYWLPGGDGGQFLPGPKSGFPTGAAVRSRGEWLIGGVFGAKPWFRWRLGTFDLTEVTEFETRPEAVNIYGWMIGISEQGQAILVSHAGTLVMPDLHTHRTGLFTNHPITISDDGRVIAGQALDKELGDNLAVVWHCG